MLNAAITILFAVICLFQPWALVIFAFLWLLEKKTAEMREEQGNELLRKIDKHFEEVEELQEVEEHRPVIRKKPNLRVVK